jgi:hypothetical protein
VKIIYKPFSGPNSGLLKNKNIIAFLCNNLINRVLITVRQIQSNKSDLCGLFAAVYFKMRSLGVSLSDFESVFSTDLDQNDKIIINFVKDL